MDPGVAFLVGCFDKPSPRSALDRDSKTVDEAMYFMVMAFAVERQFRSLALDEMDLVSPQVKRVRVERSSSLDVVELNENIEKLTKLLANICEVILMW